MTHQEIIQKSIEKTGMTNWSFDMYGNLVTDDGDGDYRVRDVEAFIFSHEFAKAFWGEQWQYHLQQQVLADDPVIYLKKGL